MSKSININELTQIIVDLFDKDLSDAQSFALGAAAKTLRKAENKVDGILPHMIQDAVKTVQRIQLEVETSPHAKQDDLFSTNPLLDPLPKQAAAAAATPASNPEEAL